MNKMSHLTFLALTEINFMNFSTGII